eukprot:1136222-Amphidinium_carterae.1
MQAHEVLGVPLAAPAEAVRAAYKRAALESHPDKGGSKDCGAASHHLNIWYRPWAQETCVHACSKAVMGGRRVWLPVP